MDRDQKTSLDTNPRKNASLPQRRWNFAEPRFASADARPRHVRCDISTSKLHGVDADSLLLSVLLMFKISNKSPCAFVTIWTDRHDQREPWSGCGDTAQRGFIASARA